MHLPVTARLELGTLVKIFTVLDQYGCELVVSAEYSHLDHLHDLSRVRRRHVAETLSSHEHQLSCVDDHHVRDIVSLRLLIAVILVLPIVALRLDVMLYASVMTTEAYRVAVRDVHTDDELEVSDRRVL